MKNISLCLIIVLFTTTGCAKLKYMEEALRLKGYAEEKDAIAVVMEDQRQLFDQLLADLDSGDLQDLHLVKETVESMYGSPVLKTPMSDGYAQWLYRDPLLAFSLPKVYLIFDETEHLVDVEYVNK